MPKQRREWKLYNEDIERTFTQHQTQITQLDSSITLQASTITNISGKVEEYYSELVVADEGISTEVAKKVGKDTIISTINQSPESVTINASKIELSSDVVTFTKMSNYSNKTFSSSDSSGNTLTISGSYMQGTDDNGYTGYVVRPYGYEIYSYDATGRMIATVRAQTARQYQKGTGTTWESVSNIYGTVWADSFYGVGLGLRIPTSYTEITSGGETVKIPIGPYYNVLAHAVDGDLNQYFRAKSFVVSYMDGASPTSYVKDAQDGTKALVIDGSETRLGRTGADTEIRGANSYVTGTTVTLGDTNSTYIVINNNSVEIHASSRFQVWGKDGRTLYLGQSGLMYTGTDGTARYITNSAGNCY